MYDTPVDVKYRSLVRSARAAIVVPLAIATIGLMAGFLGGSAERAGQVASVVIGTCAAAAAIGIALIVVALRDLRRERGGAAGLWDENELHQFVRDIFNAPR